MKRNLYRLTLAVLLFGAWAAAQTQTPQQNYPSESQSGTTQSVQPPAAQNQSSTAGEKPITPQTGQPGAANNQAMNRDDMLKNRINRVLAANPRLNDVQAVVNGGHVTLTGTVPTESDRADAKRMIEDATGVTSTTDEITIGTTPHSPPGGNDKEASPSVPQSDKGSSAQGAARGCECPKGQPNGTYAGSDQPCACSGTSTHGGESLPQQPQAKPIPPR